MKLLRLIGTLLVVLLGSWGTAFAATIILTNSSDTIDTFRTNYNTTVTNLNNALGGGGAGDPFTHPAAGQSATTSLMLFNGAASSTLFSAYGAYFGGSATSSFSSTGALTLASALALTSGGTGQTTSLAAYDALSPATTLGDLIYKGGIGSSLRLGIGTGGTVLTVSGGVPLWVATTTFSGLLTFSGGNVSLPVPKGSFVIGNDAGVAQATSSIFVSSTGNIGIGSTTPAFTFSVNTAGSDFYITSTGKIVGRDTTNGWNGRVSPTHSFVLGTATTTSWTASTTGSPYSPSIIMPFSGTLQQVRCQMDTSFLGVNVQIAGANTAPSYFVASSTVGVEKFTSANTFTVGQKVTANFGTTTTATATSTTCTFDVTET